MAHRQDSNNYAQSLSQPLNCSPWFYPSPYPHTPAILYKQRAPFKGQVMSLLCSKLPKCFSSPSWPQLWMISHFVWPLSYHAALPSASHRPASSHTWPPEAEPLCPAGSLCPDCSPAGTCTACHLTSWGVLLQHHLATLSRTTPPIPTRTLFPDCILFSTLTSNWNTYQFTILLYLY